MAWYLFTPPLTGTPNPSDPNQYTLNGDGSTPPVCPFNDTVCAIQAPDNSGKPIISTALRQEIITAVNNKTESANVLLKGDA